MGIPDASSAPPSEAKVRLHAVGEGVLLGSIGGVATVEFGVGLVEKAIGEERIEAINEPPAGVEPDPLTGIEMVMLSAPVVGGLIVSRVIYDWVSNRIRSRGGSPFIGYTGYPVEPGRKVRKL